MAMDQLENDLASLENVLDVDGEPRHRLPAEGALDLARAQVRLIRRRFEEGVYGAREPVRLGALLERLVEGRGTRGD